MRKRLHRLTADWVDTWVMEIGSGSARRHLTDTLVPPVLRSYFAAWDQDFRITRDKFGRPVCPEIDLGFNLSHSGRLAIIGVGLREKIGVDIEKIETKGVDLDSLVKEHFCALEAKAYSAAHPSLRPRIFYHVWTQKEAVTKAIGLGMKQPLEEVVVEPNPEKGCRLIALNGKAGDGWTIRSVFVGEYHVAAVAAFGAPFLVNVCGPRPGAEDFAV